ncbi:MAG: DinB family protein [Thermomicrobiales bacterium]|nr:DinB family protein [Thermomicrobiales bacterium]
MTDERNIDTVLAGDEKELLLLFLQNQRDTLLWKVSGLTCDQLQMQHPPSTLSLIGLVKHLTRVERSWLQQDLLGPDILRFDDVQDQWALEPHETCDDVIADYRFACSRSDEIVADLPLETILVDPHPLQAGVTLRWALMHMIEEIARHLGHVDLIRESIDGMVGQNPRFP